MQEKRRYARIKDKLVVYCFMSREKLIEKIERSEDISIGGIKISIPKEALEGEIVDLRIYFFNDSIPVNTKGKIIWKGKAEDKTEQQDYGKEEYFAGIEFFDLSREGQERTTRYVDKKISEKKGFTHGS